MSDEIQKPKVNKETVDSEFTYFEIDEILETELDEIMKLANDFKTKYHAIKNIRRFING